MKPENVINFWFKKLGPDQWFFKPTKKFDALIRRKFLKTYEAVVRGETAHWRKTPKGRLAEIIVLDQFSRNMFRGKPEMFKHDSLSLMLSQEAVARGIDKEFSHWEKVFLYLPYMHSESKKVQRDSIRLFKSLKNKQNTWFAMDHKKIIDKFGRYPHRNVCLGRTSTAAEKKFMLTHKGY